MDLGSLIGIVLGFGVVVYGMLLGGPMSMYVDMPSVYITILGSIFIAMMKFNIGQFLMAFKVAGKAFLITHDPQPASRADMASEGLPRLHAPIQPTCS